MKKLALTFFLILSVLSLAIAQKSDSEKSLKQILESNLRSFDLKKIETKKLYNKLINSNQFHEVSLKIGGETFELELWDSGLRSENYKLKLADGKQHEGTAPLPLKGYVKGDLSSNVRLTLNHGFISGYIRQNGKVLNVQPAKNYKENAFEDLYVSYFDSAVIDEEKHTCGVHAQLRNNIKTNTNNHAPTRVGLCYEVNVSLVADWSMFQAFGSESAVENQMEAVLNDVQGNYDDEFADEILYEHVDTWISNCSSCDPWSSTTDASDLLNEFTIWGPGNLGFHDVASLWTDRDLDGTTIGIAWVGAICTNSSYNVLQNFTSFSPQLRVLMAHELGHNWEATHDGGSGFIMSESVSSSTTWSSDSVDDIEDFLSGLGCLTDCTTGSPPIADFDYDIDQDCTPGVVEFTDESTDPLSWLWTFEGGTPNTSTEQNPVVVYNVAGIYDVTLEVSNALGTDSHTLNDIIEIASPPVAEFDYEGSELYIFFYEESFAGPGTEFLWQFGDGQVSTDANPEHFYENPGTYSVTLEVENDCDDDEITKDIEVYDTPEVGFTVDTITGCSTDTFQFTDLSYGNIAEWSWTFTGGTPATSNLQNPQVRYDSAGVYNVSLEVSNPDGDSYILEPSYITIQDTVSAGFTFNSTGSTVSFNNTSLHASSFSWNFGDGNTSVDTFPTHTYAGSGDYTVILSSINNCGIAADTQVVSISLEPMAAFTTSNSPQGCADYVVNFLDSSSNNPTAWSWSFPGGNPSTSTVQNPVVSYSSKGNYDVTLVASNSFGTTTNTQMDFVIIDEEPTLTAAYNTNLLQVNFTSQYSNAPNVTWDFGDGSSSIEDNPSHVFASEGSYNVLVTAANPCGSVTESLTITLTLMPEARFLADNNSGCATHTVNFSDNSTSNVTSWDWSFPGGNPSTSTVQNPVITYDTQGNYDVTLVVTNSAGSNTVTESSYVVVNDLPSLVAFLSARNQRQVSFASEYSNANSVSWEFGDGATSMEDNPVHNYSAEGSYLVTAAATNPCGTVTEQFTVSITDLPEARFITDDLRVGCEGQVVTFQDNSSSNVNSWNWSFPGGNPSASTLENPTVQYPSVGSYDVSLTVDNDAGSDTYSEVNYINILSDVPTIEYNQSLDGNVLSLTNMTANSTASWSISDGAQSNEQSWSHIIEGNGIYTVSITVTNLCGSNTEEFEVIVSAYPESSFTVDQTDNCAPQTIRYQNTSTQASNLLWEFPGGTPSSSTEANPEVVYEQAGSYDVMLSATNQYGSDRTEQLEVISLYDLPAVDFVSDVNGSSVSFINNSVGGVSYEWIFGDGTTSNEQNPVHTYQVSDTYIVTFRVTNECGTRTVSRTLTVDFSVPGINADFSPQGGCAPLEVEVTDLSSNDPTSWQWEFPGGFPASSTEQNPKVIYEEAGTYTIKATLANVDGVSSFEFTQVIGVTDIPVVNYNVFANADTVRIENLTEGQVEFTWDFGDGNTSNLADPEHIYNEPGSYTISLTATNECGMVELSEEVEVVFNNVQNENINETFGNWTLAPNPSSGEVFLRFEDLIDEKIDYKIFNLIGEGIQEGELVKGLKEKRLILNQNGVYLIVLRKGEAVDVRRLTILE